MDQIDIDFLKSRVGHNVRFHCTDGEVLIGRLRFVSDDEQDVIFDLVSSNRMSRYESFGECAYTLPFSEIDFVTLPES